MSLYPDQLKASEDFEEWLLNSNESTSFLVGSAGFGKSWVARNLITEVILKNSNYVPVVCSMTHSAVAVLANFVQMGVSTLHSVMGWVPYADKETGEEGISTPFMRDKNFSYEFDKDTILVIDEAGLIGNTLLKLLLEAVRKTGMRVLFIGDNKQCFPVEIDVEVTTVPVYEHCKTRFVLTIPKRVDENDMIYKLSTVLRKAVDGGRQPRLQTIMNPDGSGKGVLYTDDLEKSAVVAFKHAERHGYIDKCKCLTFTNKRALQLNRKIRKALMGKVAHPLVGEVMIANTSIKNISGELVVYNNQQLVVTGVEPTKSYGMDGAFVQFDVVKNDGSHAPLEEVLFISNSPMRLLKRLKEISTEAKRLTRIGLKADASSEWRKFYALKEGCADIRFTYAMTVNKAQGVTLKHALVDFDDLAICQNKEQVMRLAYTATSRASDYLTIEGKLVHENIFRK